MNLWMTTTKENFIASTLMSLDIGGDFEGNKITFFKSYSSL